MRSPVFFISKNASLSRNNDFGVNMQFRLSNSQHYFVVGLVGLVLWLVSGLALTNYRCEFDNLNRTFADFGVGMLPVIPGKFVYWDPN